MTNVIEKVARAIACHPDGGNIAKGDRVFLQLVVDLGGTCKVFPDQWSIANRLEARELIVGNGKHIDRTATITAAGRAALTSTER